MHYYSAYGLRIESDLPLPNLHLAERGSDILVRFDGEYREPELAAGNTVLIEQRGDEIKIFVRGVGLFLLSDGRQVTVAVAPGADPALAALYATATMLPALLYQRGYYVLHASCVDVHGSAVAFVGPSGRGKSSIAAALVSRGHRLVADDITVVELGGTPRVVPGSAAMKLFPEVTGLLECDPSLLCPIHPLEQKLRFHAEMVDQAEAVPLASIFILETGEEPAVEPLPGTEALSVLLEQSQPRMIQLPVSQAQFRRSAQLINQVPVRRLVRTTSLDDLPGLAALVERQVRPHGVEREAASVL